MSQVASVSLRPVEPADLPLFFEHQRDPIAVAMVDFKSRDRAAFDVTMRSEEWDEMNTDAKNIFDRDWIVGGWSALVDEVPVKGV